ncbi:MAG: metallophosphoesterase [Clostridia bacterium]|nr:metallophosphoesterase [Clostridia bacterium]
MRKTDMDFQVLRETANYTLKVNGIRRRYKIMHVTDVHVATAYPDESEEFQKEAELRGGAYFPPEGGSSAADRLPLFFEKAAEIKADAVLLTGDIIDFASRSNLDRLSEALDASPVKAVYCLGNHDWSSMYNYHSPEHAAAVCGNFDRIVNRSGASDKAARLPLSPHYRLEDMGDFYIFAVDDSCDRIDPAALEAAKTVFVPGGKPVLVACHVPFWSQTLEAPTRDYWRSVILIGGGGIAPDENTRAFMDLMLAPDSPVFGVIAGHIHFDHKDMLNDKIVQITTAEGHAGAYSVIEIEAAGENERSEI